MCLKTSESNTHQSIKMGQNKSKQKMDISGTPDGKDKSKDPGSAKKDKSSKKKVSQQHPQHNISQSMNRAYIAS